MDSKNQPSPSPGSESPGSEAELTLNSGNDPFQRLQPEMRRSLPNQEAIAAALEAMQRLAAESGVDGCLPGFPDDQASSEASSTCGVCGHTNRRGNQFCGMCGLPLERSAGAMPAENQQAPEAAGSSAPGPGPHHYHHHYHHHYFASGHEVGSLGSAALRGAAGEPQGRDAAKLRAPGAPGTMSRAEAAVRKVTQDWIVACNSRQLDDLVSTYALDAVVLRPNQPTVRGTAAIREFFFAVLDAGLGEVELETLRVDVVGDAAYEAGRSKMLVPVAVGKRREERGKYLTVLVRQANGEWRIVADCWSIDLSLTMSAEADAAKRGMAQGPIVKPAAPRKP